MASQIFSFTSDKSQQIEISWSWGWKDCKITENQQIIGEFASPKELRTGKEFTLANGRTVFVKLQESFWKGTGLDVQCEGKALRGSVNDPITQINLTANFIWIVAGLNVLLGVVFSFVKDKNDAGLNWGMVILGVLIATLGYFFKTYRSKASLLVVIAIMLLDIVMTVVVNHTASGVYFKIMMFVFLIRGYMAISKANLAEIEEKIEEIGQ